MPQMAPIMWAPLFIPVIMLTLMTKLTIYFISVKPSTDTHMKKNYYYTSWLW